MLKLRKARRADRKRIKALYDTAFPDDERAPYFLIRYKELLGKAEMLVCESDGDFSGFAYLVTLRDVMYLFYLAVEKGKRGKGIGGGILHELIRMNPDKRIFLAREQLDETAENYTERVNRHNFYLHNGFRDVPYCINEADVVYDVMCAGEVVTPEEYDELITAWGGRRRQIKYRMRMYENNGGRNE